MAPRRCGMLMQVAWQVLVISIAFSTAALAQSSRSIFEHLTTEYGLSSNKVEAILQDDDGFYWIATQNGLNRFDGSNVSIFRHHPEDTTSLTHNNCTAIAKDKAGDIWVATYHGVSRYRKKSGKFQRIYLHNPIRNHELANRIYHLAVDTSGNVWIAGNGLWRYDVRHNTIKLFQSNAPSSTEDPAYAVVPQIQYDPLRHGVWLSTGNGVIFFDIGTSMFYNSAYNPHGWRLFEHSKHNEFTLDHTDHLWFRDQASQCIASFAIDKNEVHITNVKITTGIRQLQADEQNRIWIFYWVERALILDPASMTIDSAFFSTPNDRSVLSEQATSLYIDHQHNYWIASGSGISIYREANQYYRLHQLTPKMHTTRSPSIRIQALAQSQPGALWIGTIDGLYTYDLNSGNTKKVSFPSALPGVATLLAVDDRLWIGSHDQLTSMDVNTQRILSQVRLEPGIIFVKQDSAQQLWAGLWSRGLFQLDEKGNIVRHYKVHPDSLPGIGSNSLIAAFADSVQLWIGYNAGNGFSSLTLSTGKWKHYNPGSIIDNTNKLSNTGTVTVIARDQMNQLWIGTHGGGMFSFDPGTNAFTHYSQANGLNSNYINSIIADKTGHLWIATADGINVMDVKTHSILQLDTDVAFRDNDFRQNGLTGVNGKIYFFFNDQVIEIDPELYATIRAPYRLVISSFTVFDRAQQLPDSNEVIRLSYDENFFSFGFSVIKTHPLQKVQYAYRIEGFDKNWIYTDRPFANYTNVPHGRYTFQVKAMNASGAWGTPLVTIPIRIHPPFWRTWWFVSLLVISISGSVYALYWYRIQHIKKMIAVRAKISRDLHDEVGSALSSIHVYSSVAEKSLEKNPQATKDALKVIHDNSRQVMENMGDIVWAINSGSQSEISLEKKLKNYGFELLTPLGIVTHYDIEPEAEQKLLHMEARKNVLLIAKEAMNNIARYSKATEARIKVGIVDHHLRLHIVDNGVGFDTENNKRGNGLYNMQKRTTSLGGQFDLRATPGGGTHILCLIPLTSIRDN